MEKSQNRVGRLISAGSADSDILYGSGFNAHDEFLYYEADGKQYIAVSVLELSRAMDEAHSHVIVRDRNDIIRKTGKRDILLGLPEYTGINEWIVPDSFPVAYADRMRNAGIIVRTMDGDFFPERAIKNEEEIEKICHAMKTTENAMRMVQEMIRQAGVNCHNMLVRKDGELLTSEYVRSEVEAEFKRQGYTADRTIIAGGAQGAAPHCIGEGPLRAGEPIVCDIFPRSDRTGYWGDMTRTFCKGKPVNAKTERAFASVLKAAEKSLAMLKAGAVGAEVHNCAARSMEADGFTAHKNADGIPCGFIHGLGHGVGLDIHEQPRLSPGNPNPLPAGAVVSVEPGLYDPEWGGIRLEDLVVIREDGYENLCTMEKELIV